MKAEMLGGPMDGFVLDVPDGARAQFFHGDCVTRKFEPELNLNDLVAGVPRIELLYRVLRRRTVNGNQAFTFCGERELV